MAKFHWLKTWYVHMYKNLSSSQKNIALKPKAIQNETSL
jgi:hypothetical protein